jgi:RNA polymerase I-specific transcription initiation factor RRN3
LDANDIFHMDDVDEQQEDEEEDSDGIVCIKTDYKAMMRKLDVCMSMVMEHIKSLERKSIDTKDPTVLYDFYYPLLDSFDRIMLPTHKLKCAQFLVFYICSLVPDTFPEDFMGLLVTHLLSGTESSVIRISSAAYLGSFIARATYIDIDAVRHCLKLMNQVCVDYVEQYESTLTGQFRVLFYLI